MELFRYWLQKVHLMNVCGEVELSDWFCDPVLKGCSMFWLWHEAQDTQRQKKICLKRCLKCVHLKACGFLWKGELLKLFFLSLAKLYKQITNTYPYVDHTSSYASAANSCVLLASEKLQSWGLRHGHYASVRVCVWLSRMYVWDSWQTQAHLTFSPALYHGKKIKQSLICNKFQNYKKKILLQV